MRWTLLAVCCLHASCPLLATAFAVAMPVVNGVQRALLLQTGRRNIIDLSRTRLVAVRVRPGTPASALQQPRPTRLVLRQQQQALFSTSQTPPPSSSQGRRRSSSLGVAVSGTETNAEGQAAETAAAAAAAAEVVAKQRASSRYIPSSYRGVRGGPKGKWKARIVSKGGLRQLGTFECELDAARAYNKAARALHGSAAKLNTLPTDAPASAAVLPAVLAGAEVPAKAEAAAAKGATGAKVAVAEAAAEGATETAVAAASKAGAEPAAGPAAAQEAQVAAKTSAEAIEAEKAGAAAAEEATAAKNATAAEKATVAATAEADESAAVAGLPAPTAAGAGRLAEGARPADSDKTDSPNPRPTLEKDGKILNPSSNPSPDVGSGSTPHAISAEPPLDPDPEPVRPVAPSSATGQEQVRATEVKGPPDMGVAVEGGVFAADPADPSGDHEYPAELDFRDLEEIPESSGPSVWDAELDSAWVGESESAAAVSRIDGSRGDSSGATAAVNGAVARADISSGSGDGTSGGSGSDISNAARGASQEQREGEGVLAAQGVLDGPPASRSATAAPAAAAAAAADTTAPTASEKSTVPVHTDESPVLPPPTLTAAPPAVGSAVSTATAASAAIASVGGEVEPGRPSRPPSVGRGKSPASSSSSSSSSAAAAAAAATTTTSSSSSSAAAAAVAARNAAALHHLHSSKPFQPQPRQAVAAVGATPPVVPEGAASVPLSMFAVQRRPTKAMAKAYVRRFLAGFKDHPDILDDFFQILRQSRAAGAHAEDVALRVGQLYFEVQRVAPKQMPLALEFSQFLPADVNLTEYILPHCSTATARQFIDIVQERVSPARFQDFLQTLHGFRFSNNPSPEDVAKVLGRIVSQLTDNEQLLEKLVRFIPKEYVKGTIFRALKEEQGHSSNGNHNTNITVKSDPTTGEAVPPGMANV